MTEKCKTKPKNVQLEYNMPLFKLKPISYSTKKLTLFRVVVSRTHRLRPVCLLFTNGTTELSAPDPYINLLVGFQLIICWESLSNIPVK